MMLARPTSILRFDVVFCSSAPQLLLFLFFSIYGLQMMPEVYHDATRLFRSITFTCL